MNMLRRFSYSNLNADDKKSLCQRTHIDFESVFATVQPILDAVNAQGDAAVEHYNERFGSPAQQLLIRPDSLPQPRLDFDVKRAIDVAYQNIRTFHLAQRRPPLTVETMPGVRCMRISRPIERVGIYVPGGTAVLPSTALMLAVPAQIAECSTTVLATPPNAEGSLSPEILYIAQLCEVDYIVLAGGAQAVAALAFGTESIPKVDKVLGPGNQFVTAAKMLLQNSRAMVSIDMPAGPSEVLVVADAQARPDFVAADLLSQAEHGVDSQAVAIALPGFDLDALDAFLFDQINQLPRKEFAAQSLAKGFVLSVDNKKQALDFLNDYAAEHLIINTKDASSWLDYVANAGSVFLGALTPESAGDYASGTNHTLPTYGYAKQYSGVSLDSYMKQITAQELSEHGLQNLGPIVETLAELEKLEAHRNAVRIRLDVLNSALKENVGNSDA